MGIKKNLPKVQRGLGFRIVEQISCRECGEPCKDWADLAHHIVKERHKDRQWALRFLAQKNNVRDFSPRTPLTEEQKELRKEMVREVSGQESFQDTVCPNCKKLNKQRLPVEYVEDYEAWRNSKGHLIVMCEGCKG